MGFVITSIHPGEAQQPKIYRIGYLAPASLSALAGRTEAFRRGLRELGYVEGKNVVIEWRSADGKLDGLPALAADLVRLNVDVIVTTGPTATRRVKEVTSTIPIVMAQDIDPVATGFVASLARPGGNITGLSSLAPEISGKQLELLKEIAPKLTRVAVLWASSNPANAQMLREMESAAETFGTKVQSLDILVSKDVQIAFQAASKASADAVLVLQNGVAAAHRKDLAELAIRSRLPAVYPRLEFVTDGGLMSYGASFADMDRRAATYVDKILRGAKPADLPIEQPTKFELVINLKAAKQIGLTIPQRVLARADRVIK